jgi:acyl-CoA reductase-like NAD-dependent aldehyde dehydrogenase
VVDNVDFVQSTGSPQTGRAVARRAVERLAPFSLELGGNDPAIVLADADLDRAACGIAWGGLCTSGQCCTSVERVYVEAPVYDRFLSMLTGLSRRYARDMTDATTATTSAPWAPRRSATSSSDT